MPCGSGAVRHMGPRAKNWREQAGGHGGNVARSHHKDNVCDGSGVADRVQISSGLDQLFDDLRRPEVPAKAHPAREAELAVHCAPQLARDADRDPLFAPAAAKDGDEDCLDGPP